MMKFPGDYLSNDRSAELSQEETADARGVPPHALPPATGLASTEKGISHLALLALTVLALFLCYLIARPFVSSLAWATALAVLGTPLQRRIAKRVRSPSLAAALTVSSLAVLIIVPGGILVPSIVREVVDGLRALKERIDSEAWDDPLERHEWIKPLWEWVKERVDLGDFVQQGGTLLTAAGAFAIKTSFIGLIELALVFFFLFYFLRDRDSLLTGLGSLLPLTRGEVDRAFRVAADTILATVYGKALVGIVQGALGGVMFWWLGLPAAWFWAVVMGLLSIVPMLGPPLVWVPAVGLLLLDGEWVRAGILAVWGAAVVGLADNLLYPIVVGRYLHMHTVPLLIALIGGVMVFGVVGFFLGPVVLALTLAMLEIWRVRATATATLPS